MKEGVEEAATAVAVTVWVGAVTVDITEEVEVVEFGVEVVEAIDEVKAVMLEVAVATKLHQVKSAVVCIVIHRVICDVLGALRGLELILCGGVVPDVLVPAARPDFCPATVQ